MSDLLRLAIAGEDDALEALHTICKGYFLAGEGGKVGGGGGGEANGRIALCFAAIEPSTGHLLVGRYDATR